jgi:phospholipid-transporting ATPase
MLVGTYTSYFDTPYAPWSTLFVLTIVVMISVIKGGVEDLKRHAADRISNHRLIQKLIPRSRKVTDTSSNGAVTELDFELVEWRRVCVGDIIRVDNNSEFPADMILLLSSEEVTWLGLHFS